MHAPLVVLGGGPGGYAAAFMAADLGMEVTLVEKDTRLGGTCLLRGCIPSKALLHVGRVVAEVREMQDWGVHFSAPKIDIDAVRSRKEKVIGDLTGGLAQLAKRRNVQIVQGQAIFTASNAIEVIQKDSGSQTLTFEHCILASGSRPARIPAFDIGSSRVMDSTAALQLEDVPDSLLVIGGGYIGLEMGTVYAELGSRVSVVELTDGLLPGADRDLVKPLHKRLKGLFEAIRLNTKVVGLKESGNGVEVSFEGPDGETAETFSRVLVAVGRRPNSDGMGLENTNVVVDSKGFVEVDKQQRTGDSHILAIGDVCGEPMLAHRASHQGKVAVESLHGEPAMFDPRAIPAVVFTDPEIAWAGLTEQEAELSGREIEISRYPWAASGRAHALGRTEGMTKILVDPETEQVLGVGIVGSGAGELIAEGALAIEMGCTARDLSETIHPHPTLGETVAFSAENYFGLATEIFRPRTGSTAR
ncbi:MAG TPA: dihydrolipoyl dehydrogenase [Planctomycetaceae bacterium]|jgi:dihydrolipoamide dehydrogenase|nr:dihydrolipoyl dehydrogenase [Planctomycetaceae bacterium]HBP80927.1 dihydrolipoyl dehydrogenase [Planctomycetaceae bacterium]|tara:strand:- start:8000 stop:9421 length:1422 start_codon:yes stop_codon:yes gene_type:complete